MYLINSFSFKKKKKIKSYQLDPTTAIMMRIVIFKNVVITGNS